MIADLCRQEEEEETRTLRERRCFVLLVGANNSARVLAPIVYVCCVGGKSALRERPRDLLREMLL